MKEKPVRCRPHVPQDHDPQGIRERDRCDSFSLVFSLVSQRSQVSSHKGLASLTLCSHFPLHFLLKCRKKRHFPLHFSLKCTKTAVTMALGGSTNLILHCLALAKEADVALSIDDYNTINAKIPLLGNLKPFGAVCDAANIFQSSSGFIDRRGGQTCWRFGGLILGWPHYRQVCDGVAR